MKSKNMSINDIAKHLQVSKSTVSQVINGKAEQARISKGLEKRILEYVKEVGFRPNVLAKNLATGKTYTIGLIVENIGDSFFGPIALRIEEEAKKNGYHVLYSSTMGKIESAASMVNLMIDRKVDGFIIAPTEGLQKDLQRILDAKIPLVLFDRNVEGIEADYICTDNYEATNAGIQTLIKEGFSNIAFITVLSSQDQMQERKKGYLDAIRQAGLKECILEIEFNSDVSQVIQLIESFTLENAELDALFFATNYLCIDGIKALKHHREKLCALGMMVFDEHDLFELHQPSITSIAQPLEELSLLIVKTLIKRIEDKSSDPVSKMVIPSRLILRESSQKKPKAKPPLD